MKIKRRSFIKLVAITPVAWTEMIAGTKHEEFGEVLPVEESVVDATDVNWSEDIDSFMQPLKMVLADVDTKEEHEFFFEVPASAVRHGERLTIEAQNDFKMVIEEDALLNSLEAKIPKSLHKIFGRKWGQLPITSFHRPLKLIKGNDLTITFSTHGLLNVS